MTTEVTVYTKPEIDIFLLGNPNCGKTSLFNAMTGERRHVGNWPGVTVEKLVGVIDAEKTTLVINDLPGTYSLSPATPEEQIVLKSIEFAADSIVLNVVDVSNLERNLLLTTQLLEVGVFPVVSLNCFDAFAAAGGKIDLQKFEAQMGVSAFPTVGRTGEGTKTLVKHLEKALDMNEYVRSSALALPEVWKNAAEELLSVQGSSWQKATAMQRYEAISRLTKLDTGTLEPELVEIRGELAENLSKGRDEKISTSSLACELATDRYNRIGKIIKSCASLPDKNIPAWQEKLDRVITSRFLGLPVFAALVAWVFWTTFTIGAFPMEWVESLVGFVSDFVKQQMSDGLLKDLVVSGIIEGVGGIIIFLPNILILFFWIAVLEDSGYMARAAFIMDRMMSSIGLQGRAFIPMVMGIGCNVPAVMATRIIESRFQRLLTMFLIPLVTCVARIPVLVLLCATFFPESPSKWMFVLFFLNIIVIMFLGQLTSMLFKHTDNSLFLLEMPPYRLPTPSSVYHILYEKGAHFITKAGTVILAGSILIWVLTVFPRDITLSTDYNAAIAKLKSVQVTEKVTKEIDDLTRKRDIELMEGRYLARFGKVFYPIMEPLGFSWRETVALVPGFLAKEAVVSSLGILYAPFDEDTGIAMKKTGMTPLKAFVFMFFILLYTPCLATVGILWRESGSIKFVIVSLLVYFGIAYGTSFAILKLGDSLLTRSPSGDWSEGLIIGGLVVFACWYLLKIFISSIIGSRCETCSHNGRCQTKGNTNCSGSC